MLSLMAQVNVELKARDPDPEATAARCLSLGAVDYGRIEQRDTYFAARRGRLKLREDDGGTELIAYRRPDTTEASESTYIRLPRARIGDRGARQRPRHGGRGLEAPSGCSSGRACGSTSMRSRGWEASSSSRRCCRTPAISRPRRRRWPACAHELGDRGRRAGRRSATRTCCSTARRPCCARPTSPCATPTRRIRSSRWAPRCGRRSGAIYAGANVENAAYPQGQCAEASALGALVAAGETAITGWRWSPNASDVCPPCGGCRQRLSEFGDAATPVYLGPTTTDPGRALARRVRPRGA